MFHDAIGLKVECWRSFEKRVHVTSIGFDCANLKIGTGSSDFEKRHVAVEPARLIVQCSEPIILLGNRKSIICILRLSQVNRKTFVKKKSK